MKSAKSPSSTLPHVDSLMGTQDTDLPRLAELIRAYAPYDGSHELPALRQEFRIGKKFPAIWQRVIFVHGLPCISSESRTNFWYISVGSCITDVDIIRPFDKGKVSLLVYQFEVVNAITD